MHEPSSVRMTSPFALAWRPSAVMAISAADSSERRLGDGLGLRLGRRGAGAFAMDGIRDFARDGSARCTVSDGRTMNRVTEGLEYVTQPVGVLGVAAEQVPVVRAG